MLAPKASRVNVENSMRKLMTLFAATVFGAMALLSNSNEAQAHRYRGGNGGGAAIAALVIGGIAIAALSRRHHRHHYYDSYYDDGYAYNNYPRRRYYSSYSYAPSYGYGYRPHHNFVGAGFGGFGGHHHRGHW
jgi:hypothetical protein